MPDLAVLRSIVPELRDALVVRSLTSGPLADKWLLRADNEQYVVRIDRPAARSIGLDRSAESAVLESFASVGWCDAPLYVNPADGALVVPWVPGTVWAAEQFHQTAYLQRLAQLLVGLHSLQLGLPPLRLAERNRIYASIADNRDARGRAADIEAMLSEVAAGPGAGSACHNDPVAGNVLTTVAGPRLIDFEYAAGNNSHFDLAAVIEYHGLSATEQAILLDGYSISGGQVDSAALAVWRRIYRLTTANWREACHSATA